MESQAKQSMVAFFKAFDAADLMAEDGLDPYFEKMSILEEEFYDICDADDETQSIFFPNCGSAIFDIITKTFQDMTEKKQWMTSTDTMMAVLAEQVSFRVPPRYTVCTEC
jgi:hypothetical protein